MGCMVCKSTMCVALVSQCSHPETNNTHWEDHENLVSSTGSIQPNRSAPAPGHTGEVDACIPVIPCELDYNLVGGFSPTPLKNDGVRPVGMMKFPTEWKVIIHSMVPVTTKQNKPLIETNCRCRSKMVQESIVNWVVVSSWFFYHFLVAEIPMIQIFHGLVLNSAALL